MADRTLLLTGVGAPEWCRALLETGKFIRLWRGQAPRQASGLYGASREYGGADWRNPPRGTEYGRRAENLRYDKTRKANQGDKPNPNPKPKPDFEPLNQPAKAPEQDSVSTGYALRASGKVVSAVLRVLRDFPDVFRMDERGSMTIVDCVSQAKARDAVIQRIDNSLSERESA